MTEEWELNELRRELSGLERRIDKFEEKEQQRSERLQRWLVKVAWTAYVAALTTYVVLSVTG